MQPIIIDTDIGDDIDDALALALAAVSPELEILGITTVLGDVARRAAQARRVLACFGHPEIPIYEGCKGTFHAPKLSKEAPLPLLWDPEDQGSYQSQEKSAVDFIIETIRDHPQTIIIAIGPLSNLALAVKKAPDIMKEVQIYAMGGAFDSAYAEYNIACDPEAAGYLLDHQVRLRFFGIEQTSKTHIMERDEQRMSQAESAGCRLLCRMIAHIRERRGFRAYLHDLFPLYAVLHPEACTYSQEKLWIEKYGQRTRGTTIVDKDYFHNNTERPNAEVGVVEDADDVRRCFLKRVYGID